MITFVYFLSFAFVCSMTQLAAQPPGTYVTSDAWSGWDCASADADPPPWPECPDAWSGWLAHAIGNTP